jgi:hypothetical protein
VTPAEASNKKIRRIVLLNQQVPVRELNERDTSWILAEGTGKNPLVKAGWNSGEPKGRVFFPHFALKLNGGFV